MGGIQFGDRYAAAPIETSEGVFWGEFSGSGLARLWFPDRLSNDAVASLRDKVVEIPDSLLRWVETTGRAIESVFGNRVPLELPPYDLTRGTLFQTKVWEALSTIQCGEVRSYGQVAENVGSPGGMRAVGAACGKNPIPVLIPCHRVLNSTGHLGGFSAGLHWKRRLLKIEGIFWKERLGKA
jgi:methylated-DNA-[protein]-cysteine S-methyltransferase